MVRGPAWAEYHLLLSPSPRPFTRIAREIRTPGGAPLVALLLARWRLECQGDECAPVELSLSLGRDPNARLLRRELEAQASRVPSLQLRLREDEAAPHVPYRILMWPPGDSSTQGAAASTSGAPQVLQCGESNTSVIQIEIEPGKHPQVLEVPVAEAAGSEVQAAARAWALLLGLGVDRAGELAQSALEAWRAKPVEGRVAGEVAWREVERVEAQG